MKVKDGESVDAGDGVYFDPLTGTVTKTAPGAGSATVFSVGVAVSSASVSDAYVLVRLGGTPF